MKRVALAILAALAVAGCTSTVVLGTLTTDGGPPGNDFAHPLFDLADGGIFTDLGDFGPDGFDGAVLVDLAH